MSVNSYDDRKVSLQRPHGNGDLDIVRASYTRRMANVTEALLILMNDLGKRDKMRGLPSILSPFATSLSNSIIQEQFIKFNNTRARMLDDIKNFISVVKPLKFCHYVRDVVMDVIMFPVNL